MADQVGPEKRWDIFQIDYAENEGGVKRIKPKSVWIGPEFSNESGNLEVKRILGKAIFDTAKPVGLLSYCIEQVKDKDGIILDFFAGSGTTAHAVLEMNRQDGGNRKFILVQLPESLDRTDYSTISNITKERVRRVIKGMNSDDLPRTGQLPLEEAVPHDRGFRVFKLADSNFKPWDAGVPHESGALQQQLDLFIDHIKEGRTDHDLLFEILIKRGFPLTTQVETLTLAGQEVFGVAGTMMLVCLERELTLELIRAMADLNPECVVCLDEGFAGNDQLKTNAVQIFKTKGVAKFLTV